MSTLVRSRIAVVAAAADAAMLTEWLRAAGFEPVQPGQGEAAVLARWPYAGELAAVAAPLVVCHDKGALPPREGVFAAARALEWPDASDVRSLLGWSTACAQALRQACGAVLPPARPTAVAPAANPAERGDRTPPQLIAVGISTGGPVALREFLAALRGRDLPPMVIVQHIPPAFVADLIGRLARETGYRVELAKDGLALARGVAYIAPGDHHVKVIGGAPLRVVWNDEPPRRGHRPAADVLFESCLSLAGRGVGVIMTGMGQDGASGLLALRQAGWTTIGQDEASCAIYGMPRAAMQLGAVEREYPLAQLGAALVAACEGRLPAKARV
ncbi:MAG: chemotaxis protein CheB [Phycisphaerales bacterium]|jgi:two-component system chemotaxis response regulator CheB|nr:chemotaxis protein CheB [Phycisphaerales bacterium]